MAPTFTVVRDHAVIATPAFAGFDPEPSRDGKTLITGGFDSTFQFWRVQPSGKSEFLDALRAVDETPTPSKSFVFSLSSDGSMFSVVGFRGGVQVWRRSPLEKIDGFETNEPGLTTNVGFDQDDSSVLYNLKGIGYRRNLKTGETTVLSLLGPYALLPHSHLAVTPTGLLDLSTGKTVRQWKSKLANDLPVSISPDSRYALIAGEDPNWSPPPYASSESAYIRNQTLRVWRISDGKLLRTLPGFSTTGEASRTLLWTSPHSVYAPGLGWEKDILSGRTIRSFPPGEDSHFTRVPNVVRMVGLQGNEQRFRNVVLPRLGVQLRQAAVDPNGGIFLYRNSRDTFRAPNSSYPAPLVLSRISPEGTLTTSGFNNYSTEGQLVADASGPFLKSEYLLEEKGRSLYFKIESHPTREGVVKSVVDKIRFEEGHAPKKTQERIEGPDSFRQVLRDEVEYPMNTRRGGFSVGDRFAFLDPFGSRRLSCTSLSSGRRLWTLANPGRSTILGSFSAGARWCADQVEDRAHPLNKQLPLRIINASTGEVAYRLPTEILSQTQFSREGNRLAIGGSDFLASVDLSRRQPTIVPFDAQTRPVPGDVEHLRLSWMANDQRLMVVDSLQPLQIIDVASRKRVASLVVFDDKSWLALGSDGQADGSPTQLAQAKVWSNGVWRTAKRSPGFLFKLLKN